MYSKHYLFSIVISFLLINTIFSEGVFEEAEKSYRPESIGIKIEDDLSVFFNSNFESITILKDFVISEIKKFNIDVIPKPDSEADFCVYLNLISIDDFTNLLKKNNLQCSNINNQTFFYNVEDKCLSLYSTSRIGLIFGIKAFVKSIYVYENQLIVSDLKICNSPVFQNRYVSEYYIPDFRFFGNLVSLGYNGFVVSYRWTEWDVYSDTRNEELKIIKNFRDQFPDFKFIIQYHLSGRGGGLFDHSSNYDREKLYALIESDINQGSPTGIMICYDDILPELNSEESKIYTNAGEAHIELLDDLTQRFARELEIYYCTPFYQGLQYKTWNYDYKYKQIRDDYIQALKTWDNIEVKLVWTGPTTASKKISRGDVDAYRQVIGYQHELFYWDNTWAYRQPIPNFHSNYYRGFENEGSSSSILLYVFGNAPHTQIYLMTASDYLWNPENYDEKKSLNMAISELYTEEAIYKFDEFYKIRGDFYNDQFMQKVDVVSLKNIFENLYPYISEDFKIYLINYLDRVKAIQN